MTLLVGPLSYLIYHVLITNNPELSISLFKQIGNLSVILATFSFTMLGFLAAVITILFSFSSSEPFKKYKRMGYLNVFFGLYYLSIANLLMTFIMSIISLSGNVWIMRISIMSTINNIVQIFILTAIIINLSNKSSN